MNRVNTWIELINSVSGTIVSAGTESIQLYAFDGRIRNLALVMSESHPWIESWNRQGIRTFCLDNQAQIPAGNTGRLLLAPATLNFLQTLEQPVYILMFKPDAASSAELQAAGFQVLGCDPVLARRLENKLIFPDIARDAGVAIPRTQSIVLDISSSSCRDSVPTDFPFICQFAKGFSGNRTFLVRSQDEWVVLNRTFTGRTCRVSQWSEGDTWTANGCVFRNGSIPVTRPFMQETRMFQPADGLPVRIGSRGNRWGCTPDDLAGTIRTVMEKLGKVLRERGYYGFFGADLIIEPENREILAIETNPRITASAPVLTSFEMNGENPPMIAAHIAASLNLPWPWQGSPDSPPPGGQLIFRPDGTAVPDVLMKCDTGIYRIENKRLVRLRDGCSAAQLDKGEILIWKPLTSRCSSEILRLIYRDDPEPFLDQIEKLQ